MPRPRIVIPTEVGDLYCTTLISMHAVIGK